MPKSKFWSYAEEAMILATRSKTEQQKLAMMDLARTWAKLAMQSDNMAANKSEKDRKTDVHMAVI